MEWVFRDYRISLNQEKDPLQHRDEVMDFDVPNKTKYLEKNTKLQELTSNLQENVKEMVTDYWDIFCDDGFRRTIRGFLFHIDTGNHIPI